MAEPVRFRRYEARDLGAYIDLYRRVFGKAIDARFLAWKHRCDPSGGGALPLIFVAVGGDGGLLGANSFFPAEIADGGATLPVVQSGDTMVSDAVRGRGVYTGIVAHALPELAAAGYRAVFGWANRNSLPGMLKNGFVSPCWVHLLRRPLRWWRFAARKARAPRVLSHALCALDDLRPGAPHLRLVARASSLDDPAFLSLMARAGADRLHQPRTAAYFDYKYRHKPAGSYEAVTLADGITPCAAALVRRDDAAGADGTIVERVAAPGARGQALAALYEHCRDRGFDHLSTWQMSSGPGRDAALARAPFRVLPAWRHGSIFFEQGVGLAFIVNTLDQSLAHLKDHRRWYFTAGDADTA